jgi:hypothetical protein
MPQVIVLASGSDLTLPNCAVLDRGGSAALRRGAARAALSLGGPLARARRHQPLQQPSTRIGRTSSAPYQVSGLPRHSIVPLTCTASMASSPSASILSPANRVRVDWRPDQPSWCYSGRRPHPASLAGVGIVVPADDLAGAKRRIVRPCHPPSQDLLAVTPSA